MISDFVNLCLTRRHLKYYIVIVTILIISLSYFRGTSLDQLIYSISLLRASRTAVSYRCYKFVLAVTQYLQVT
jgi:hypothetical protein